MSETGTGAERHSGPSGSHLTVEWFKRGRGPFGLDRRTSRTAGATHARITEHDAAGRVIGQWIEPKDRVDPIVADVTARWSSAGEGQTPERTTAGPVRRTTPRCRSCGVERVSRGSQHFVQKVRVAANLSLDSDRLTFEVFACPLCGSVELFEVG